MKTNENEQIGEMIQQILLNEFSLRIFQLWPGSSPAGSPPVNYVAIQSDNLRETPELNQRYLKGETLIEAMTKAHNVSKYIIDNSKPIFH